jgi:hypothetical protein
LSKGLPRASGRGVEWVDFIFKSPLKILVSLLPPNWQQPIKPAIFDFKALGCWKDHLFQVAQKGPDAS